MTSALGEHLSHFSYRNFYFPVITQFSAVPIDKGQRETLKACSRLYDEVEFIKELVRRFEKNKEEQHLLRLSDLEMTG